ncbi:hypothetical protein PG2022B_1913 [Bifidobacterium animalis subsp. animalis]|nr:hypothetical protein PG2022B_1913 [Bifidobacterium animalis subsp. animalis]
MHGFSTSSMPGAPMYVYDEPPLRIAFIRNRTSVKRLPTIDVKHPPIVENVKVTA